MTNICKRQLMKLQLAQIVRHTNIKDRGLTWTHWTREKRILTWISTTFSTNLGRTRRNRITDSAKWLLLERKTWVLPTTLSLGACQVRAKRANWVKTVLEAVNKAERGSGKPKETQVQSCFETRKSWENFTILAGKSSRMVEFKKWHCIYSTLRSMSSTCWKSFRRSPRWD